MDFSAAQQFVGMLAHELGHRNDPNYQGDLTTWFPAQQEDSYARRLEAGLMGEGKGIYNNYIIKREILAAGGPNDNIHLRDKMTPGPRAALLRMRDAVLAGNIDEAIREAAQSAGLARPSNSSAGSYIEYYWQQFNNDRIAAGQGGNDNGTTFRTEWHGDTSDTWTYGPGGNALYRDIYRSSDGALVHQSFTTGQLSVLNGVNQTLATFNAGSFPSFTAIPSLPAGSQPTLGETVSGPTVIIGPIVFVNVS